MNLSYLAYKEYFEEFWRAYPRKEGRERAYLEYCKVIDSREVPHDEIVEKAKKYAYHNKAFLLMPERWLRDKRWQDELPDVPKSNPSQLLIWKIDSITNKTPLFSELRQIGALLKTDDGSAINHFKDKKVNNEPVMDYVYRHIEKMNKVTASYDKTS